MTMGMDSAVTVGEATQPDQGKWWWVPPTAARLTTAAAESFRFSELLATPL
jgi:hypothetical protein